MAAQDDYYYDDDDDAIEVYESTAVDPSYYLLLFTAIFCLVSNMMLPCFVSWGRRWFGAHKVEFPDEEEMEDTKEEREEDVGEGQDVPVGGQTESRVDAKTGSTLEQEEHALTRGALARFTNNDPYFRAALPSTFSHMSRSTTRTASSSVLEGGYIAPVHRGGRRRRGAVARRRALQVEQFNSMRNNEFEQVSSPAAHPLSEYAASEVSGSVASSRRPQSLPGGPLRRKKHSRTAKMSVWQHEQSEVDAAALEPDCRDPDEPAVVEDFAAENVDICCGERAWWRPSMISQMFDDFLQLAEYDKDSKRLMQLAVPFALSEVISGVWELVIVSLIAHYIGTRAVAAYTLADIFISLTEELLWGIVETVSVLCPHAIGAGNNVLAGQYVQITAVLFAASMLPCICIWLAFTDNLVLALGLDQETARMAQNYANIAVFTGLAEGVVEAFCNLLDCIDMEKFLFLMDVTEEFIGGMALVLLLTLKENPTLTEVALFDLLIGLIFSVFVIGFPVMKGWVRDYLKGMAGACALKNTTAVKKVVKTAIPLCIGELLANGEWEVLTFFVAHIGPAETAAWGIVGILWEAIEATSTGFADAGEIRTAYHLGGGRPSRAKSSGYKCILISFAMASLLTSIMFIFGENMAIWFTSDPTLQRIIVDVIPLVGLGNVALTAGSVSWALVGAQGRYRLATIVFALSSWGVTLPLAALFTFPFNINLQGITSAVVIGYSVAGTALTYLLILSDWDGLSRKIVAENAVEEAEIEQDDDDASTGDEISLRSFNTNGQPTLRSLN